VRIALVSTAFEDTPPQGYGGTERVVALLARGLVARGHEVTVFATGTSRCAGELRSWYGAPQRPYDLRRDVVHTSWALRQALGAFDLIHTHTKVAPFLAALTPEAPILHTLHNNALDYTAVPTHPFVALSRFQQRLHATLPIAGVVPNGIDLAEFPFCPRPGGYLMFLGRFDPKRAPHLAIAAARSAGCELVLAGKIKDPAYFAQHIQPHLDGRRVRYVGELGPEKAQYLGGALALISPLTFDDPFGLVHIEAMACGTPVLGVRRGALPELVDAETGVLVEAPEQLGDAVGALRAVDRARCRQRVADLFTADRMVERYLAIYAALLGRG
jgi:glycosyltransferase involved in cell wall biosynthesis